jgi:uncharacterized protein YjgD (DUF1641 family)
MATNALVLGGGSGGLVAANKVKKLLGDRVEVTLVDKNGHHEFMPAYPWVPLRGAGGGPGELAETLEKLDKSGALAFMGHLSENFGEGLGMLMEPQLLRLISHGANVLDILSRIEPAAIGMMASALQRGLSETFTPETMRDPPKVGLTGILKMLADPEVQKALGVVFLLLKALGKAFGHMNEDMKALEAMMAKMMPKK